MLPTRIEELEDIFLEATNMFVSMNLQQSKLLGIQWGNTILFERASKDKPEQMLCIYCIALDFYVQKTLSQKFSVFLY